MRRFLAISAPVLAAALLSACASSSSNSTPAANGDPSMEKPIVHNVTADDIAKAKSKQAVASDTAIMYVNGMGCPLCATNIDKQLKRVPGVKDVKVDLGSGMVTVGLLPGATHPSPARLGDAVEDAGFTLVKIEER
ncbi:MAG: heavy-metal-associated domain-containing protein [Planctomycetes bacterium]|nr:heavy-metal-associated domain-containing protein [Planctomycetota bacterium]